MAKVITQETVDKAVAKAVTAETKRCLAHVKVIRVPDAETDMVSKDHVKGFKAALKEVRTGLAP